MISHRLGMELQRNTAYVDELLAAAHRQKGAMDEVWLATDYGFPPLQTHFAHAKELAVIKEKFTAAGVKVSMQFSNTLGHGPANSSLDCSGLVYPNSPAEPIIGHDGKAGAYSFCYNGPHFRAYTLAWARAYGAVEPETIWIDDDFRAMNHGDAQFGCFCEICMAAFNEKYNATFDRTALVEKIAFDITWRENWAIFVEESLYDLAYRLAEAVLAVSPNTRFGYQHGGYAGYTRNSLGYVFQGLRDAAGKPPLSRPGGGCYHAHNPNEIIDKTLDIRWQKARLPEYVAEVVPEVENLPFVTFGKAPQTTCTEASAHLASGCTGLSFSLMMFDYEPIAWHEKTFAGFAAHKAYWEKLAAASRHTKDSGISLYLPEDYWKKPAAIAGDFSWTSVPFKKGTGHMRNAIPYAYDQTDDPVLFLHEAVAETLLGEHMDYIARMPVLTSGAALEVLQKRGLGEWFGIEAIPCETQKLYETFTGHAINRESAGKQWAQGAFANKVHFLADKTGRGEVFSVFGTKAKDAPDLSGAAGMIITAKGGGRWAVFGNDLFHPFISFDRRNQILAAAEYIAGRPLAAALYERQQTVLLPRVDKNTGKTVAVSLINCSIGVSETMTLRIRRPAGERFVFASAEAGEIPLQAAQEGEDFCVKVPEIHGWTVGTVFIE